MSKSKRNNIHIPLPEDEALRLFAKVKPTEEMPRPGATGKKAVTKPKKPTGKNDSVY